MPVVTFPRKVNFYRISPGDYFCQNPHNFENLSRSSPNLIIYSIEGLSEPERQGLKEVLADVLQNRYILKKYAKFRGENLCWNDFLMKLRTFK